MNLLTLRDYIFGSIESNSLLESLCTLLDFMALPDEEFFRILSNPLKGARIHCGSLYNNALIPNCRPCLELLPSIGSSFRLGLKSQLSGIIAIIFYEVHLTDRLLCEVDRMHLPCLKWLNWRVHWELYPDLTSELCSLNWPWGVHNQGNSAIRTVLDDMGRGAISFLAFWNSVNWVGEPDRHTCHSKYWRQEAHRSLYGLSIKLTSRRGSEISVILISAIKHH